MLKKLALAAALTLTSAGIAMAADHLTPGTPGDKNCQGQSAAFLAQASKNGLADEAFHGIGGIGRFSDLSVKEVQAAIDAFCNP